MTANTQAVDALDVVGGLCWRLVAIDGAGNFGTSDGGASLTVDAADAGLDAGLPGGEDPEDAGVDRAEPLLLSVGCGCDGGAGSLSWLTLFWLVGPAKKRRARRASC